MSTIYVKPGKDAASKINGFTQPGLPFDETNKVALWSPEPKPHILVDESWLPFGGVYITGDSANPGHVYAVADTPDVNEAVNLGRLVAVTKEDYDAWVEAHPKKVAEPEPPKTVTIVLVRETDGTVRPATATEIKEVMG